MLDTILIVDGDSVQSQVTKQAISEKLKYKTLAVASGNEAISLILSADCAVSLMLLDMRMPQADVLHVIKFIKLHKPDFPIIIMTEYGDTDCAAEAVRVGANDFLTKPVSIERLGLSISNALRIRYLCKMIEKLEGQLATDGVKNVPSSFNILNSSSLVSDGKVKKLRVLEEDAIRFALNACGGSMSKAARSLGIGRSTLYRKVGELERHSNSSNYISRENQTTRPMIVTSDMEHS